MKPFESLMTRTLMGPLAAVMQLFAFYVFLHGHYGPGGAFQAGVLLAASVILPQLVVGGETGPRFTLRAAAAFTAAGVAVFASIGLASIALGQQLFAYEALPIASNMADRHSMGILLIEIGVVMAVSGGLVTIFYGLTQPLGGEES